MIFDFRGDRDDEIGMNPSRTIGSPHPQINTTRQESCNIFALVIRTPDLNYRGSPWHGIVNSENLGGNFSFENAKHENNSEVNKVGRKSFVIWNHKYSDSIHMDLNHTDSNQPIPADSTNIR